MAFEKLKKEAWRKNISELNKEIQERKKELLKWNNPHEREQIVQPHPYGGLRYKSKHPFDKIRKELAILNTIVHNKLQNDILRHSKECGFQR